MKRDYRRLGAVSSVFALAIGFIAASFTTTNTTSSAALLTAAAVVVSCQDLFAGVSWSKVRLGTRKAVRATLIAGIGAILALHATPGSWDMLAAFIALALGIVNLGFEATLQKGGSRSWRQVFNLPGRQEAPPVIFPGRTIYWAQAAWLFLGIIDLALGFGGLLWLSGSLVISAAMAFCALTVLRRLKHERIANLDLPQLIKDYAPEFIIYTARPDDASYQVQMWLPYLERTGRRFIIVTRAAVPSKALAMVTDAPIVMCARVADIDAIAIESVKAVFYVNASSGNGVMVRYSQYTHVYLGHGDSDKAPSYNPTHAMYDKIFAAGPAATRRYAEHGVTVDAGKFEVVGRPQLETVAVREEPGSGPTPVVLYAPTWRGHVEETFLHSLPVGEELLKQVLARGTKVIFRPHPFSYHFPEDKATIERIHRLLERDSIATGREHIWGERAETEMSIIDCINASDCMVSDVSSVVSDYLYSNKPFAMVAVNVPAEEFAVEYPIARAAYVLENSLANLDQILDSLLLTDPLRDVRISLRNDYLGNTPHDTYADTFIQAAIAVIAPPSGPVTSGRIVEDSAESADAPDPESADESEQDDQIEELETNGLARRLGRLKRTALRTTRRFLSEILAIGALAAGISFGFHQGIFLALALIHTVFFFYVNRRSLRGAAKINRLLNTRVTSRMILLVAMLAGLFPFERNSLAVAGVIAIAFGVAIEGQARGIWATSGLMSANLPGTESAKPLPFPRGLATICSNITIGLSALMIHLGASGPSGLVVLVAGLVAFGLTLFILAFGVLRRRVNRRLEADLPELLEQFAPEFCVYFASDVGVRYQLGMWEPYFQRMGKPYIVVTRSLKMMRAAAKATDAPVIYRPTLGSLESVLTPTLTTAFYVNNAVKNTHFIERRELQHIWLNHGDSEKPACYNPVHAIYDKIFSAGQAGIDRYERHGVMIPRESFEIVGRPQVEDILAKEQSPEETTVLYAPTWKGPYADSEVYSLPRGEEIVTELLTRNCRVIFRAHPFNYRFSNDVETIERIGALLDADALKTGRNHVWGAAAEQDMSVVDCFNSSTAMISDVSAMVSDFLQSTKPFAVTAMNSTPAELELQMPATKSGYILNGNMSNLGNVMDELLETDTLADFRLEMRRYYLGDIPQETYAERFIDSANQIVDRDRIPSGQ